jgi:hypothetical protein
VSQRNAARKFGISVGYVNKLLKSDQLGCIVKCRKKIKIPNRSEVQLATLIRLQIVFNIRQSQSMKKKLMVWVAASINGLSEIYVVPSRGTISSDIYIEECLEKHYSMPYVFWSDLASAHYANTIDCPNDHNAKFVVKNENPTNIPECRPIERFWYMWKAEVYKDDWCAQSLKQLERKIRACVKNVNPNLLVMLFGGLRSKIRDVGRNGTIETR